MGYSTYTYPKFRVDFLKDVPTSALVPNTPLSVGDIASLTSGSLPTGMTLDSTTGKINGTPTVVGDYDAIIAITGPHATVFHLTFVVLDIKIVISGGVENPTIFTNWTSITNTFSVTYTGSFTPDTPASTVWTLVESNQFPETLSLAGGTTVTQSFSGTVYEAGNFSVVWNIVDEVAHSITKRFWFQVDQASIPSPILPVIDHITDIGATSGQLLTYIYTKTNGLADHWWFDYETGTDDVLSSWTSDLALTTDTGTLTVTPNSNGTFKRHIALKEKAYSYEGISVPDETVNKTSLGVSPTEYGPNTFIGYFSSYTTTDPTENHKVYKISKSSPGGTLTIGTPITYAPPVLALASKGTFGYAITAPVFGTSTLRKIDDGVEVFTDTFSSSSTNIFDFVISRAGTYAVILVDLGLGTSKVIRYDLSTPGSFTDSSLSTSKKYTSACSAIEGVNEYFYILNVTDSELIKYNPVTDTSVSFPISGGIFEANLAKDSVTNSNNKYIFVSDSARGKVYKFSFAAVDFVATFSGFNTPAAICSDPEFFYVVNQGTNLITAHNVNDDSEYTIHVKNNNTYQEVLDDSLSPIVTSLKATVKPTSVVITQNTTNSVVTVTDDGNGNLTTMLGTVGSIDYSTGAISLVKPTGYVSSTSLATYETLATSININLEASTLTSTLFINGGGMTYIDRADVFQQTFDSGNTSMTSSSAQIFRVNLNSPPTYNNNYSAVGVVAPVTVTVVAGATATGTTITADGNIGFDLTGVPTTPGHYIVTMKIDKTVLGTPDEIVINLEDWEAT